MRNSMSVKLEPERTSDRPRGDVWNVCHRMVAFGAGERHENRGLLESVANRATEVAVHRHDLPVANAFVPGDGEPFPCLFEEMELVMQLTLRRRFPCDHRPRRRGAARRGYKSRCARSARSRPARAVAERRRRWPAPNAMARKTKTVTGWNPTRGQRWESAIRLPSTSGDAPVAVRASGAEAASGRMSTRLMYAATNEEEEVPPLNKRERKPFPRLQNRPRITGAWARDDWATSLPSVTFWRR